MEMAKHNADKNQKNIFNSIILSEWTPACSSNYQYNIEVITQMNNRKIREIFGDTTHLTVCQRTHKKRPDLADSFFPEKFWLRRFSQHRRKGVLKTAQYSTLH